MFGSMADLLSFRRQLYKDCLICSRGAVSLARCFNDGQVSVRMRRSRERSSRRNADRRLRSPESEGRIIATSGGRPDKKNTICYIYNSTSYSYGAFPIFIALNTN